MPVSVRYLACPWARRCEQVYKAAAAQPGFDGPSLIELGMLHLLVHIYQASQTCLLTF